MEMLPVPVVEEVLPVEVLPVPVEVEPAWRIEPIVASRSSCSSRAVKLVSRPWSAVQAAVKLVSRPWR